jgi:hypothetical protein
MSETNKTLIRKAVISTGVATAIGLVVANFWQWLGVGWRWLIQFGHVLAGHFESKVQTPVWLLYVGGVCMLVCALLLLRALVGSFFGARPAYRSYVVDVFDNHRWRWRYDSEGHISGMQAFCPKCETRLVRTTQEVYGHAPWQGAQSILRMHCETCRHDVYTGDGEYFSDLEGRVGRQIERKLRTDTWQQSADGTAQSSEVNA